jgi:hypothetical protein
MSRWQMPMMRAYASRIPLGKPETDDASADALV